MYWKMGILCQNTHTHIYTYEGDRNKCENYGGITPLICIYNVLSSIVCNKLTGYTEKRIGDYQNTFVPNRGAMNDIHIMRRIIEKVYNTQTDILSIDFKHAFDSIYRHKIKKYIYMEYPVNL